MNIIKMCECGKGFVMAPYLTELTVEQWGPTVWKLLHIIATRVGKGDAMIDADAANGLYFTINRLYEVLPCQECQRHARTYIAEHKFNPRGLEGVALRSYVEQWLLDFHNAVRARKSQPIIVGNVEEYEALWSAQRFLPCDDEALTLYFNYGKMFKIIDLVKFTSWFNQLKRLRLLLGV